MTKSLSAVERLIETIEHNGAVIELIERPDVAWVGTLSYADNLTDEPNFGKLMDRYRELVSSAPKTERINEDWDACFSINFACGGTAPKGVMFAQETYAPDKQDKRYDLLTQPAGLYMRVYNDKSAAGLLGKESCETYELFGALNDVAKQYGYERNKEVSMDIEYHNWRDNSWYAYIPVLKSAKD